MSLPHDSEAGLGALWRRLWPRPTGRHVSTAALPVLLCLGPCVFQGYDPLLPACVHLLFGGHHVAVTPRIRRGIGGGHRSFSIVCHFGVTCAAPIRVLDFCPDAAVHHADQVCGLTDTHTKIETQVLIFNITFRCIFDDVTFSFNYIVNLLTIKAAGKSGESEGCYCNLKFWGM